MTVSPLVTGMVVGVTGSFVMALGIGAEIMQLGVRTPIDSLDEAPLGVPLPGQAHT